MECKLIPTLIFLLLSSSSSFSSSSSSSSSSSLTLIEGKLRETVQFSPPLLFLSRLLSRASAGQEDSAALESSLLSLTTLISAVEEEIERLDKEREEKIGKENDVGDGERELGRKREIEEERRGRFGGRNEGNEERSEGKEEEIEERGETRKDKLINEIRNVRMMDGREMEEEEREKERKEEEQLNKKEEEGKEEKEIQEKTEKDEKQEKEENGEEETEHQENNEKEKENQEGKENGKEEKEDEGKHAEKHQEKREKEERKLEKHENMKDMRSEEDQDRKNIGKETRKHKENIGKEEERNEKQEEGRKNIEETTRKHKEKIGKEEESKEKQEEGRKNIEEATIKHKEKIGKEEEIKEKQEEGRKNIEEATIKHKEKIGKEEERNEKQEEGSKNIEEATRKHKEKIGKEEERKEKQEEGEFSKQVLLKPPIPPSWIEQIEEKIQEILDNFKASLASSFQHILSYYLPTNRSSGINEECAIDVGDDTLLAPVNRRWFVKLYDSWGKFPDGFLFGNLKAPGMFEECTQLEVSYVATVEGRNVTRSYAGRYCTVSYRPNDTASKEERGFRAVLPSLRSGVSLATLANPLPFTYGTCIPSTCTAEDLQVSLEDVFLEDGLELAGVECQMEEKEEETVLTPEDKAFISIISIFIILAVLATVYEAIVIVRKISSFELLLNFSLLRNLGRVFTYESGKDTGDVITCLPMLRVVTMLWIIICHQYETNATFIVNTFDSLSYQEPAIGQIVTNGWLSVDTFFFLAGLVLTFRLAPYMRPNNSIAQNVKIIAAVILRRIVRLAPVILVVALFCASILRLLAHGPNASTLESFSQDVCAKHWWKDPLFINNYLFPGNEGDNVNDCLSHCWYTAVDVQLLLLLPVIFLPAVYHQLTGVVILCILTVGSVVIPLVITLAFDLPPSPLHHVLGEERLTYMTHVFMAPWCRMGPWLVGVWTGLLLRTSRARRLRINKLVVLAGYIVAITMGFLLVLGLLPYNRLHFSLDYVDRDWRDYPVVAAFYGSLARPTWALCVAWVVFTCYTGNAELINTILSYPGWLPVARLTFAIYIVAPVVQLWWAAGLMTPSYYSYLSKLFESSGVFSISLLLAIILTCLVELPVITTFNLFLPSPAKKHERAVIANIASREGGSREGWSNNNFEGGKIFPL